MALLGDFPNLKPFPRLVDVVGPVVVEAKLQELKNAYMTDRSKLRVERKRHSRAFWNTLVTVAVEPDPNRREWARFLLEIIENGLVQADRCKKANSFRARLATDGEGFWQVLAELHILGCIGPLASALDTEQPGSKTGKNYDFCFRIDGVELHIDSKWRTETPLGTVTAKAYFDIEALLSVGFDAVAIAKLVDNRISDENALEIAVLVDDARQLLRSDMKGAVKVDAFNAHDHLKGAAYDETIPWLTNSKVPPKVFAAKAGGASVAYFPDSAKFIFDSKLISEATFRLLDDGSKGACLLIPRSQSQPVHHPAAGGSHDVAYPEHMRIKDLVADVHEQFPTAPVNLVFVGTMDRELLYDIELAMLGLQDGQQRKGGAFQEASFQAVSGALGFTLVPPHPTLGLEREQWAKVWHNDNCSNRMADGLAAKLCAALGEVPKDLSSW